MTRDIYRPFPEGEREEKLQAFAEFVKERDGVPDLATRTLSRREETLKRFRGTTILYPGTFDRALFDAQYRHYDKRRKTPQEILLLLTFIKFNNVEAFAVEKSFRAVERGVVRFKDDLELILLLEEHYHTKILLSAANLFGLNLEPRFEASIGVRVINTATLRLPDVIRYPLLLVAEFLGVIMLLRMLRSLREIFKATPPLCDALEERLIDVLIDEIGHVTYNRLQLNSWGLAQAKLCLPLVAVGIGSPVGEARALGLFPVPWRDVFTFEMKQIPEEIRRQAFIA